MKFFAGLLLGFLLLGATAAVAVPPPDAEPEDSLTQLPREPAPPPAGAPRQDQPKAVTVGDTTLSLPPLDGFHEVYGSNKSFDGVVEQFVTPGNRMLAVYVSDSDIAAMNADPQSGIKKYILVQTRNEDIHVRDAADFDAVRKAVAAEVGDGSLKDSKDVDDEVAKAAGYMHNTFGKDLQIKVGETKFLGKFVDSREALSYLLATDYGVTTPEGTKSYPIMAAMSVLTVKQRVLFIFVYSDYKSAADIDYATQNTKKFLDRVFVANGGSPGEVSAGSSGEAPVKTAAAAPAGAGAGESAAAADASVPLEWATWGAILVALIAGAVVAGPKILKRLGKEDERK